MKLTIRHLHKMKRSWLLKREFGEYSQHAHFYTKEEAELCRKFIDLNKLPREKKYRLAMRRLLTLEEYNNLKKKPPYKNNPSRVRR